MPVNIVTSEELYFFKEDLIQNIKSLLEAHGVSNRKLLRSSKVLEMLNISIGTLHNFRDKGILPHSKVSGIIFYEYEDIIGMLRKHNV